MRQSAVVSFIKDNVDGDFPSLYADKSSCGIRGYIRACKDLDVKYQKDGRKHFFTKNDREIGYTTGLTPSLVSKSAWKICADKTQTLSVLEKKGVQRRSIIFTASMDSFDFFLESWSDCGAPNEVVVKPSHGSGGNGITIGVSNEKELQQAWQEAIKGAVKTGEIIVEPYFSGLDVRVIVVNGKSVCSTVRLPPYVIGDGKSSLLELIAVKNKLRSIHPHHQRYPIPLGLIGNASSSRVLSKSEVYLLSNVANIHQGGEAVNCEGIIPESVLKTAEKAVSAIDGLGCAGVDLMVNEHGECKILEINVASNFGIHYYPMFGQPYNPAKDVIVEMLRLSTTS